MAWKWITKWDNFLSSKQFIRTIVYFHYSVFFVNSMAETFSMLKCPKYQTKFKPFFWYQKISIIHINENSNGFFNSLLIITISIFVWKIIFFTTITNFNANLIAMKFEINGRICPILLFNFYLLFHNENRMCWDFIRRTTVQSSFAFWGGKDTPARINMW